jgi:ribosome recycling factor
MIDEIKETLNELSEKVMTNLGQQLGRLKTGRASASLLDSVKVDYYGTLTPIAQVGNISTPEARLLQIQPFDKSMLGAIEKAILGANLGVTPSNDGNFIRIPFPQLTEEGRKDIVKKVKKLGEDSKIAIRNGRRDQNEVVKKAEKAKEISEDESKNFQAEIQKVVDQIIAKVDEIVEAKEKEVMTV